MNYANDNLINRQLWVESVLKNLPPGLKIIDVGAGECQYKKHCGHLEYVSQDFNQYTGKGDGVGFQTGNWDVSRIDIVSDILNIPVDDQSFDIVLCTEVLEHVPDPISALKEMTRILRNGGTLIVTSPFCSLTHFAPYHYCDGFNKYFYEFHLNDLNYEILELSTNGNYFRYVSQELQRLPSMVEQYLNKKSILVKLFSILLVKFLSWIDKNDSGSDTILCYGYHVRAKKQK
jgi:ubiquinone/menaquinone biosynthesis C-methylase UbiE